MSFNRTKPNRLGPRFGEIMGKNCHAAITAANKGDRKAYDARVADIYRMLDTVETETWGAKDDAADQPTEPVSPPSVAAEGEPAKASTRDKKKALAGAAKSQRSRKSTGRGAVKALSTEGSE